MKIVQQYNSYGAPHQEPKSIIVHAMGEFISPDGHTWMKAADFLEHKGLSVHALVAPDATIYRCRNDDDGAYHAAGFNTDSLGVEILVPGKHDYPSFTQSIRYKYTNELQYAALVWQVKEWIKLYNITDIKRHSDVSPGRKIDPGAGFDWGKFMEDVKNGNSKYLV